MLDAPDGDAADGPENHQQRYPRGIDRGAAELRLTRVRPRRRLTAPIRKPPKRGGKDTAGI